MRKKKELCLYWLREEHGLIKWFSKQIPNAFQRLITFPMVLFLSIYLRKKNPLISSSHRSLQFLPHASPSAWTTSLKLFYCPITNYPYKHLHYPQGTEFPSLYAQQEIKPKSKQKQWPFPTVMCEILSRGWYQLSQFKWGSFAVTCLFVVVGQRAEPGLPVTKMNRQMAWTKVVTFGPSQGCHF